MLSFTRYTSCPTWTGQDGRVERALCARVATEHVPLEDGSSRSAALRAEAAGSTA